MPRGARHWDTWEWPLCPVAGTRPAHPATRPPRSTLKAASMCNTTGEGESLIAHSRSWLTGPGTPPVNFNSKSSTSLDSGETGKARGRGRKQGRVPSASGPGCLAFAGLSSACGQATAGAAHRTPRPLHGALPRRGLLPQLVRGRSRPRLPSPQYLWSPCRAPLQ